MQSWSRMDFGTGKIIFLDITQKEDMLQVEYPNGFLLDMGWYQDRYIIFVIQMTTLQTRRVHLLEAQQADLALTGRLQEAESLLAGTPSEISEWDEALVRQTVETVKVLSAHEILVCLKGGMEIREKVGG